MKNREKELQEELEMLKSMLDTFPFDVWHKDMNGRYLYVNKYFEEYAGKSKEEILGKNDFEIFSKEEAKTYVKSDKETLDGLLNEVFEVDLPNGVCKEELKKPIFDSKGTLLGTVGFSRDISEKKKALAGLTKSEERFRTIFEKSQIGIGIFDSITGKAYHINKKLAEILGRTEEEVLELKWEDYSHKDDISKNLEQMTLLNCKEIESFSLDKRLVKADGTVIWTNIMVTPFEAEDGIDVPCHMCMVNDISAQKRAEEESFYLNYHDQLTGLYNRRYYEEELTLLDTEDNLPLSLIMADVNGLKLTNDAFGHLEGDRLLVLISEALKEGCRDTDYVARMGGDEFIIFLPRTSNQDARTILEKISERINNISFENVICSVSFGLATKTFEIDDMKKVFMLAEDNMYRNKLTESRSMRHETIKVVRETLYQKNKREQYHCERVSQLCEALGKEVGLSSTEIIELKMAGMLHDIGKIGIDEKILDKQGSLSSVEWDDMERHPEIGYHILRSVNEFAFIAEYVLCHHERVDGKGYPRNLNERQIPIQSKIISIADSYDAMTSERAYKNTISKEQAITEIRRNAGTQFDKELAHIFIEKVLKAV